MKKLFFITILLVGFNATSQEKGCLTFELNANQLRYNNAHTFNNYLRDTSGYETNFLGSKYQNDTLTASFNFGAALTYQACDFMDFGVFANFQRTTFERQYYRQEFVNNPILGYILADRRIEVSNTAIAFGFASTIHLNRILHFENKESAFIKRFQLGIGLRLGYVFNSMQDTRWLEGYEVIQPENFEPQVA